MRTCDALSGHAQLVVVHMRRWSSGGRAVGGVRACPWKIRAAEQLQSPKGDYSHSTREPVGCFRDCRCNAVRSAPACRMVRAAALHSGFARIRGRIAQFNKINVLIHQEKRAPAIAGLQGQSVPGCLLAAAWEAGLVASWQQRAA